MLRRLLRRFRTVRESAAQQEVSGLGVEYLEGCRKSQATTTTTARLPVGAWTAHGEPSFQLCIANRCRIWDSRTFAAEQRSDALAVLRAVHLRDARIGIDHHQLRHGMRLHKIGQLLARERWQLTWPGNRDRCAAARCLPL